MKLTANIFSLLAIFGFIFFTGCEEVDDPYSHIDEVIDDFGDPAFNDTNWNDTNFTGRVIMLEDFTGHTCHNCPRGTDIGEDLMELHPDNLIVTAIHNSDGFSKPELPKYPANFETETGENIRLNFGLNFFPIAMINRHDFNGNNSRGVSVELWTDYVNQLLDDPQYMDPSLDIDYMLIYNTENRLLRIFPKVSVNKAISGDVYLNVFIAENGIVSPQKDSRYNPEYIEDYVHNHMLRAGFEQNEVGVPIFSSPQAGEVYRNDNVATADYIIDNEWIVGWQCISICISN